MGPCLTERQRSWERSRIHGQPRAFWTLSWLGPDWGDDIVNVHVKGGAPSGAVRRRWALGRWALGRWALGRWARGRWTRGRWARGRWAWGRRAREPRRRTRRGSTVWAKVDAFAPSRTPLWCWRMKHGRSIHHLQMGAERAELPDERRARGAGGPSSARGMGPHGGVQASCFLFGRDRG